MLDRNRSLYHEHLPILLTFPSNLKRGLSFTGTDFSAITTLDNKNFHNSVAARLGISRNPFSIKLAKLNGLDLVVIKQPDFAKSIINT